MARPFPYVIYTPEGTADLGECELLVVPTQKGEMGVMYGHIPLLAEITFGEMRITRNRRVHKLFIEEGFMEIFAKKVTLMVGHVLTPQQIRKGKHEYREELRDLTQKGEQGDGERLERIARLKSILSIIRDDEPRF